MNSASPSCSALGHPQPISRVATVHPQAYFLTNLGLVFDSRTADVGRGTPLPESVTRTDDKQQFDSLPFEPVRRTGRRPRAAGSCRCNKLPASNLLEASPALHQAFEVR